MSEVLDKLIEDVVGEGAKREEAERVLDDLLKRLDKAESKPKPEEKANVSRWMIRVYLLSFKFPTENLVVKTRIRVDDRYVYQTGEADKKLYQRLKQLRTKFEYLKRKFMYQSDFGWFAFSEEGVREARQVLEEAVKVVREVRPDKAHEYVVDVIEVWLKPEDARKLLENARRYLEEDLSQIEEKLEEYEKAEKRKMLATLRYQWRMMNQKLDKLIKELRKIPT